MVFVYFIPVFIALGIVWAFYRLLKALYSYKKKVSRAKRVNRIQKLENKVDEEYNEESEFLSSI